MNQNTLNDPTTPQLDNAHFHAPAVADFNLNLSTTSPKILLLYGSLRETSYSRKVVEESARILNKMGAETKIFNPSGLPLVDDVEANPHGAERQSQRIT